MAKTRKIKQWVNKKNKSNSIKRGKILNNNIEILKSLKKDSVMNGEKQ